jgi:CarD family transcriptional regulator
VFKVGEYIVHGRNGVCKVADITHIDISGADKNQLYYTLVPEKNKGSKIFYPVTGGKIAMRPVMTKEEAEIMVTKMSDIKPTWIENDRQREMLYKEAIGSCDCQRLIGIIKTLYERNMERVAQGKRITYVDDRYLKEAKQNLNDELSIALGMDRSEVETYIKEHIQ